MKLSTKHFGELDVTDDKIITFEEGIPGLEGTKYVLISDEDPDGDVSNFFFWLQSVDVPDIALVMIDVLKVMPDYDPLVDAEELESIGGFDPANIFVYNVAVIPENIQKLSVNLKAPVVINDKTKKGKQVVSRNENYGVRHHIFEELNQK